MTRVLSLTIFFMLCVSFILVYNTARADAAPSQTDNSQIAEESAFNSSENLSERLPSFISPFEMTVYEGHTYNLFPADGMSWDDMKSACEARNGHLACIANEQENNFLFNYVQSNEFELVYFGLYCDEDNNWHWIDGATTEYMPWASGEPNGGWDNEPYGCYYNIYENGEWNDGNGSGGYYLCEWDEDIKGLIESVKEEVYGSYSTLEKGSKGNEVKALQQRLVDLYWLQGSVDGDYGNKTKSAIERFQEAAGLPKTGVADGQTQAVLFANDAPEDHLSISYSVGSINSYVKSFWNVNGQEFSLEGNQTKTLKTPWGTYKFFGTGEYKQID